MPFINCFMLGKSLNLPSLGFLSCKTELVIVTSQLFCKSNEIEVKALYKPQSTIPGQCILPSRDSLLRSSVVRRKECRQKDASGVESQNPPSAAVDRGHVCKPSQASVQAFLLGLWWPCAYGPRHTDPPRSHTGLIQIHKR